MGSAPPTERREQASHWWAEPTLRQPDVIDTWIWYKTENEVDALRIRPHPYEFAMYYDI